MAAILKNDPQTKYIPIIMLSVLQDKERGFDIGIDEYLTKPIDTDKLLRCIANLLRKGSSSKKVMVVDEDSSTIGTLMGVLQKKGYEAVESNGKEMMDRAIKDKPDIIIMKSGDSENEETMRSLRMKNELENVLFLVYE
jgi:DNA-binding response OmpR family regulator